MHLKTHRRRTAALLLVLALAAVLLAACGSSSSTTTGSNASASATAPGGSGATGASGATGPRGGRFKAVRECLTKQGITLPTPPSGARRPGGGGFLGGGISGGQKLPAGVTRQQFEAALKKCGAGGALRQTALARQKPCLQEIARHVLDLHERTRDQASRPEHERQRPRVQHLGDQHEEQSLPHGRRSLPEQDPFFRTTGRRRSRRAARGTTAGRHTARRRHTGKRLIGPATSAP